MDPQNSNPQGENDSLRKLEEDLRNLNNQPQPVTNSDFGREGLGDTATPTVMPTSDQSKSSVFGNVLILIIGVAMLLFAVMQLMAMSNKGNSGNISSTVTQTPPSTPDATSGWKTYTDVKYGFSFKYPTNLENKGVVAGPYTGTSAEIQSFSDPKTIMEGTDAPFDGFSTYYVTNMKATNFETFILNEKKTMDNSAYASMVGAKKINIQNGGVAFVTDTRGYYYIPTLDKKNVIVFAYIQKNPTFKPVFDQILTTFKFTAVRSSTPVAKACTLEAKICPNGTSVGRTGPNCEFAECSK